MGRSPCCDKATVKKGQWSPDEDAKFKSYIEQHGTGGSWIALPRKIGLKRCGKSCRLRWLNYLRPNIKHGGFSQEEDDVICGLYVSIGSRWSVMASQLPGRTDNDIKNYWNTRLKKKLFGERPKEPPHGRRASACHQKQEAKGDDNGDRRRQPALVYPIDHVPGASYGGPLVVPSSALPRQQIRDDDDGDLVGSAWSSLPGTPGGQALQDPSGFSTELHEALGLNQVTLEESNATAESEKMSSLYSDPAIKGCEGIATVSAARADGMHLRFDVVDRCLESATKFGS